MSTPCSHDWVPMYTDRQSPQSYEGGVYRGFKVVGKRCRLCDETRLDDPQPAPPTPLRNSSCFTGADFSIHQGDHP